VTRSIAMLAAAGTLSFAAVQAAPQEPTGRDLYVKYCVACHGETGTPTRLARAQWSTIPTLSAPGFLEARSDDSLAAVAHKGVGKDMPPYNAKLTREQMLAVAHYVRSLGTKTP